MGNPWLFRCRPNDNYSSKVMADFGVRDLKKNKWAFVHSTDAAGSAFTELLLSALKDLGVTPVLNEGFNNGQVDLTPVVLAVRESGADVLATDITFNNDDALLARQIKQLGVNIPWVGSATVASPISRRLGGAALYGSYAVPDFDANANPEAKEFVAEFEKTYGHTTDNQGAWPYDAVMLTVEALKKVGGTDPMKLRDALHSIKGYKGTEGTYNFDQNGDGLHGYNIVQNQNGTLVFIRRISFD